MPRPRTAPCLIPRPAPASHNSLQVLSLAGELLGNAEGLLREGLHTAEIADGYQKALDKVRFLPAPTFVLLHSHLRSLSSSVTHGC